MPESPESLRRMNLPRRLTTSLVEFNMPNLLKWHETPNNRKKCMFYPED
jgi:hypothetical protein